MIHKITSLEFLLFVLEQDPSRKYDMRDELKNSPVGSPLAHFCRAEKIPFTAVGAMDVYNDRSPIKVEAALEMPIQTHFTHLDMEGCGTYGQLQNTIRERYMEELSAFA
jgi:hypothetical protein